MDVAIQGAVLSARNDTFLYNRNHCSSAAKFYFMGVHKMNKRRKSKILLAVCLMASMMFLQVSQAVTAVAADEVKIQVANYEELKAAIYAANDGDVIGITAALEFDSEVTIGSPYKTVTLRRMNSNGRFQFGGSNDVKMQVQNIIFDGNNIEAGHNYFMIYSRNSEFKNSSFINCIATGSGGAMYISSGNVTFENCTFDNNKGYRGGHISTGGDCNLLMKNTTMKNGYAIDSGGAIHNGSSIQNFQITSCNITENKADGSGGGIANIGSMTIEKSKVYNNKAKNGGSDIANEEYGKLSLKDSDASLMESFSDIKVLPDGWFLDAKPDEKVILPSDISGEAYLHLKYSVIEDKPDPTPDPLPKPDDKPKPDESKPVPAPVINNYYTDDHTRTTRTETTILPQPPETVKTTEPTKAQEQVIKFETNLQQGVPQIIDDGNGTITVNVNVTSDAVKDDGGGEIQPTNSITWIQAVIACLLFGILVCLLRRR